MTITDKFPQSLITLLNHLNSFGEFYLVGGCVRDALLDRKPKDFDILVVRPTPEELEMKLPVMKVGASFPVYLYDTEDPALGVIEFAYARKETKVGTGYKGFDVQIVSDVKEDLARRDLTVNALAWSPTSGLVSFDDRSLADVQNHNLRHVTEAFAEDPLRVFRAARFCAQLPGDWTVDSETIKLMGSLKGELSSLALDRVRIELEKAMVSHRPEAFFSVLWRANCLDYWFPEINVPEVVHLFKIAAHRMDVTGMYCLMAQTMDSPEGVKTFCKRLSLAWVREMSLWRTIRTNGFQTPQDFLFAYKASRQGKLSLEGLEDLMWVTGMNRFIPTLLAATAAVKALDFQGVDPKKIPGMMLDAITSAI